MSTNESISVEVKLNFRELPTISRNPIPVIGKTNIIFTLDSGSLDGGYRFAGYADYSHGTGSQLTGTTPDSGKTYQLNDVDTIANNDIKITLFIRNNCNPAIRFSYDPQIVNDR